MGRHQQGVRDAPRRAARDHGRSSGGNAAGRWQRRQPGSMPPPALSHCEFVGAAPLVAARPNRPAGAQTHTEPTARWAPSSDFARSRAGQAWRQTALSEQYRFNAACEGLLSCSNSSETRPRPVAKMRRVDARPRPVNGLLALPRPQPARPPALSAMYLRNRTADSRYFRRPGFSNRNSPLLPGVTRSRAPSPFTSATAICIPPPVRVL